MLDGVRAVGIAATLLGLSTIVSAQDEREEEGEFEEEYGDADPELGEVSSAEGSVPAGLTVYGGVRLGLGGEADYDPGGQDDLVATFGLQAGADYVIMEYFALGGELRLSAFNTDAADERGDGRSLLFDFVVRPRGRYLLDSAPMELYATLPLGLTIPSIDDDWSANGKAGFTFGIGAGANYFISDQLGFGGEMVYLKHWIGLESTVVSGGLPSDYDVTLGQFYFVGNVIYAL